MQHSDKTSVLRQYKKNDVFEEIDVFKTDDDYIGDVEISKKAGGAITFFIQNEDSEDDIWRMVTMPLALKKNRYAATLKRLFLNAIYRKKYEKVFEIKANDWRHKIFKTLPPETRKALLEKKFVKICAVHKNKKKKNSKK